MDGLNTDRLIEDDITSSRVFTTNRENTVLTEENEQEMIKQ